MPKHLPQWLAPLWRQMIMALVCGAMMTLIYAPFEHGLLVFFILPVWFYLILRSQAPGKVGFAFGLGWFGAGISWVHVSIADYGGVPLLVSLALMGLLCSYLALFPALFARLLAWVNKHSQQQLLPTLLAAPIFWYAVEYLRGVLLTGFPWLSLGYSQINGSAHATHLIPIFGELGTSAWIVLVCICLTPATNRYLWRHAIEPKSNGLFALGLFLAVFMKYTNWQWEIEDPQQSVNLALVQGNIPQSLRWVPEEDANTMNKYLSLTQALWDTHDVIIWPEAAIPQLEPLAEDYLAALQQQSMASDTPLITGILNYRVQTNEAFNNVIVIDKQYAYEHANRYAKHHLLPIGEFVPFEAVLRELAPIFDLPMSSFTRGAYLQPNLQAGALSLTTALCYEILFARQVRDNLTPKTNAILTLSNDAWFGASHDPHQHMQIAQIRALELGLPVIRATNNGITGVIDHFGQVTAQLEQFSTSHLSYALPLKKRRTPYFHFGESINMIWLGILLMIAVYCMVSTRKQTLQSQ